MGEERAAEYFHLLFERTPIGAEIPPCPELQEACNRLESFLYGVLWDSCAEWDEVLDGVDPIRVTKIGEREVDIVAIAILINDQTVTLMHARLQIDSRGKSIPWLELKLGERVNGSWLREKYGEDKILRRLSLKDWNLDAVDWYFKAGYGERQS